MAAFDIVNAAGYGYYKVWQERRWLVRLAAVPLAVKIICFLVIGTKGWGDRLLLQGLALLPSYLADGWMLSHFVRLLFLGQRWPFRLSGNIMQDRAAIKDRLRGVMAGTAAYAASRFLFTGFMAAGTDAKNLFVPLLKKSGLHDPHEIGLAALCAFLAVLGLWGFRLLWFYIPAALHYNLRQCLRDLRGALTSFYMLGASVICFLPLLALAGFLISFISTAFTHGGATSLPVAVIDLETVLRALTDIVVALILTGCMAHGLQAMIARKRFSTEA